MNALVIALTVYLAALALWLWALPRPETRPAFVPVDIRFCTDWRDRQPELCERIPFRKEVAI